MSVSIRSLVVLLGTLAGCGTVFADQPQPERGDLDVSPELRGLLREEMREIAGASQAIAAALVSADWTSIHRAGEQIRASYVLAGKLTAAQKRELHERLPARFKRLDSEFHARAGRLSEAAAAGDAEQVAFHYYRMLEACAACHSAYAKSRFPGFSKTASSTRPH